MRKQPVPCTLPQASLFFFFYQMGSCFEHPKNAHTNVSIHFTWNLNLVMSNSSDVIMVLAVWRLYMNCSIWPLTCCSTTRPFSASGSCQRSKAWILGVWPCCWEDRHNADMHNCGKYCNFPDDYHVALWKHREPIFFILNESTCRRCSSPADPLSLQKSLNIPPSLMFLMSPHRD